MFKRSNSRYHAAFSVTTRTTLSNEVTAQWHRHSRLPRGDPSPTKGLCAFAAPSIQAMSNTAPSRDTEFLIANLELEFESSHSKQSPLKFSNRKYFAIFLSLLHAFPPPPQPQRILNRNSQISEFRLTPAPSPLTHFLTATKSALSPFVSAPAFLLAKAFPAI